MENLKEKAIANFFSYLELFKSRTFLFYYEPQYSSMAQILQLRASNFNFQFLIEEICDESVTNFINNFSNETQYIFAYDVLLHSHQISDSLNLLRTELKKTLKNKKTIALIDINGYFNEIFFSSFSDTRNLNNSLIELGKKSKMMYVSDNNNSLLEIELNPDKWGNIDGSLTINDFLPSEIANAPINVNGVINFVGGFISQIPLAAKYGLIKEPLKLIIQDRKIIDVYTKNLELKKDILEILADNDGNTILEEAGIGTNQGVILRGIGLPFEERHCGFHAGFGGKVANSFHWDAIFQESRICFDDKLIFDNKNGFLL